MRSARARTSAASNAITPLQTIFDAATPAQLDSGDPNAVRPRRQVQVRHLRHWSTASASTRRRPTPGTHVGTLWTTGGTKLAQVTFTSETASGWQQANFSTPVIVSRDTTYIAAYLAPNGHYSDTSPGLNTAVDNPPLHALANSTSAQRPLRLRLAAASFPTNTFNATNYFVDVVFSTAGPPGAGDRRPAPRPTAAPPT